MEEFGQLRNNLNISKRDEFSVEVNSLFEILIKEENILKYLSENDTNVNLLVDVLDYFKVYLRELIKRKSQMKCTGDFLEVDFLRAEIKKVEGICKILYRYKENYGNDSIQELFDSNIFQSDFLEKKQVLTNLKCKSKNDDSDLFQDNVKISETQMIIKNAMLENACLFSYKLCDILYAFGNLIKYDAIGDSLIFYAKEIVNRIVCEKALKDDIADGIYYIRDCIKYRIANTDKSDKVIRKNLKDIRMLFDFVVKGYQEDKKKESHDYLFNIVEYFLDSEDKFLYLKGIVEGIPKIVNTRYINKESKESEHIVIYIIDKFIINYRKMLHDKNSDYINKDYLREVYFLFTSSYALTLTSHEKTIIDSKLFNFMSEVNNFLVSSKRKNAVVRDLKDMSTNKFYIDRKSNLLENVNEYKLEVQMNSIFMRMNEAIYEHKYRIDDTDKPVVIFKNDSHAYSLVKDSDKYILRIYVIDLYPLITRSSELDKYIFNQTLTGLKVDPFIVRNISMKKGGVYPTITYEIAFDLRGNYLEGVQICGSKIKVTEKYTDYDLVYNSFEKLNLYKELYQKFCDKNDGFKNESYFLSDIEFFFENVLNSLVIQYFSNNELPFIYSGVGYDNEEDFIRIMDRIGYIFSVLEKDDFNKISNIINNNVDFFHYSMEPFNGEYKLDILNPLSYSGILIQRLLHELVINNKNNILEEGRLKKQFRKYFEEFVMYFNYYNNYVDKDVLRNNKGKLYRKIL